MFISGSGQGCANSTVFFNYYLRLYGFFVIFNSYDVFKLLPSNRETALKETTLLRKKNEIVFFYHNVVIKTVVLCIFQ